jgi:hypothetical protein
VGAGGGHLLLLMEDARSPEAGGIVGECGLTRGARARTSSPGDPSRSALADAVHDPHKTGANSLVRSEQDATQAVTTDEIR